MTTTSRYRIDHCGIVVPRLADAVAFYEDVLGFTVLSQSPAGELDGAIVGLDSRATLRWALLDAGGARIELIEYLEPRGVAPRRSSDQGLGHLALTVTDIDAAVRELTEHGVRFYTDVIRNESGIQAGRAWVYGEDPWGVVLELGQNPEDLP